MIFWIWITVLTTVLILYLRKVYTRFSRCKVKHLTPVPFLGNTWMSITRWKHFVDVMQLLYNKFPGEKFVGQYDFITPMVVLRDIELIKQVTVKDFETFLNHRVLIDENNDPYFGSNLFSLKDQKWKDMRSTLSPAFTSSKIRLMVPFMVEVGDQMIASLKKKMKEQGSDSLVIDGKDLSTRYANDVIATCAFGLKVDSMMDENNDFYAMGKETNNFTFSRMMKFFGFISIPFVMNKLKVKLIPANVRNFFTELVLGTMINREAHNIVRPDMIHLLMEAKRGNLTYDQRSKDEDAGFATVEESSVGKNSINRVWSDTDLIAQALLFFMAGFDTVATAMAFLLYELALNPDCQEKLYQEIKETSKNVEQFDYNTIQNMKYLDMVVSEGLRKWPSAAATDRVALKTYNIGKPNDKATEDYIIRKGEGVWIPIYCIHYDPEYFENPKKFDPERFSEENKHKIKSNTYMPFGNGPRNCIGSRFALCEIKVMIYQLIKEMEVLPSEKTCIPPVLATESFQFRLKGGHWLKIRARKN